jgi:hypothetical protein
MGRALPRVARLTISCRCRISTVKQPAATSTREPGTPFRTIATHAVEDLAKDQAHQPDNAPLSGLIAVANFARHGRPAESPPVAGGAAAARSSCAIPANSAASVDAVSVGASITSPPLPVY